MQSNSLLDSDLLLSSGVSARTSKFKIYKDATLRETLKDLKSTPTEPPVPFFLSYANYPGRVVGDLTFHFRGHEAGASYPQEIPMPTSKLSIIKSKALFILLVDNEEFGELRNGWFCERFLCIVVGSGGKGPDLATAFFLRKLEHEFNKHVLALLNADPKGSSTLCYYAKNGVNIKRLGLRPSDWDKLRIPGWTINNLTRKEVGKVRNLLEKECIKENPSWVHEFNLMFEKRQHYEVLGLNVFGIEFQTRLYLSLKLQENDRI